MVVVKEFVDRKLDNFPVLFYKSLPTECPDCGQPMIMNETITRLSCSNWRCPSKIVQRMDSMVKQLGIKNFGEARITSFVETYKFTNPLILFAWGTDTVGKDLPFAPNISMDVTKDILKQVADKKSMTLSEYVKIANIPNVQNSASKIFGDYDDINEAYKDILEGGASFIQKKLDISEISTRVLSVYDALLKFKEDLLEGIEFVDIIKLHKAESIFLRAVVSDEVGSGFKTKQQFYDTCNSLDENLHVEFMSSVNKNIDYLIWAGADGSPARYTSKVKKVTDYNAQYNAKESAGKLKEGDHFIPLVTANQFINVLKQKIQGK